MRWTARARQTVMLFALLTGCGVAACVAPGCTQTQLDTLTECSMDIVAFGGFAFWQDINCTDATLSGFRDDQADALKDIRREIRQQTKAAGEAAPPPETITKESPHHENESTD